MSPDDFRRLTAAGLSNEQIAVVMEIMAAGDEDRKAKQRARWAKHQINKKNTNVSQREQTLANVPHASVTRVEVKPLPQIEEQKESKGKSAASRATRLPADWTLPQPWREDAIALGLPEPLIDFEAAKMRDWSLSAKNGAKLDWHATWRNWCRDHAAAMPRGSPSVPKPKLADGFERFGNQLRQQREIQSRDSVQGFPTLIQNLSLVPGGR